MSVDASVPAPPEVTAADSAPTAAPLPLSDPTSSPAVVDLDRVADAAADDSFSFPAAHYWDAATMAPLNPISAAAIARLRAYRPPPFPTWDRLPVSRRAAVLVLLFADRHGDLRVVITMRAASLRSFSGHAAFPGGKADSLTETPYQIARREAWEEIGLPMDDAKIPRPFRIEPLCHLPCSLAKTELAVRPCVAFLHADGGGGGDGAAVPPADESLIPRLDAKEVAAVFSGPLHNFLRTRDEEPRRAPAGAGGGDGGAAPLPLPLPDGDWYDGRWSRWHGADWRVHNFYVPVHDQRVTTARIRAGGQAALVDEEEPPVQRFLVWGLTGRMLVDTARVAYAEEPEFEHNAHYGDEDLIARLEAEGALPEKPKRRDVVGLDAVADDAKDAKM